MLMAIQKLINNGINNGIQFFNKLYCHYEKIHCYLIIGYYQRKS